MKGFKMGYLDENGNIVEIPENIQKHIETREKYWFDKMKEIDAKCSVLLEQLALTEKALELACEKCLSFPCSDYCSSNADCEDCYYKREFTPENFKTKAKEMMKSE